jgi:hypothetical protein
MSHSAENAPEPLVRAPDDTANLLEQYRLAVEMADKVSERRAGANRFFVTILSAFVAFVSASFQFLSKEEVVAVSTLTVGVVAIVLSVLWWRLIQIFVALNRAKFAVINELEEHLPARPYGEEWRRLQHEGYVGLSYVESFVPWAFAVLFLALGIGAAVVGFG